MTFNHDRFYSFIQEQQVIKSFENPIRLKSGKMSHTYVNWRSVSEDAFLLDQLTDFILDFATEYSIQPDTFFGVPEGATKLGILTQFKYAQRNAYTKGSHTVSMGRSNPKEHGDPHDRFFVGAPKGGICVIEDVTTTGGSLISCIKSLQTQSFDVIAAIGLTNRDEFRDDGKSVKEALAEQHVDYYEMSNSREILNRKHIN